MPKNVKMKEVVHKQSFNSYRKGNFDLFPIELDVGFLADKSTTLGIPTYMYYNEMGTATIPSRPLVKNLSKSKVANELVKRYIIKQIEPLKSYKHIEASFGVLGELLIKEGKDLHNKGTPPPNAPATKRKKRVAELGHIQELIDSGAARTSWASRVRS